MAQNHPHDFTKRLNLNMVRTLLKADDFIAENGFRLAFDPLEQQA